MRAYCNRNPSFPLENEKFKEVNVISLPADRQVSHPSVLAPTRVAFVWLQASDDELAAALEAALSCGYRHIDTAFFYGNEAVIGKVLQDWIDAEKVTREELFVVTKLPPAGMHKSCLRDYIDRSMRDLRVDYLDLYLIHTPFGVEHHDFNMFPVDEDGTILRDKDTDFIALWKILEEEVDSGRFKAIGVSNFNQGQLQRLLDNCRIKPANLQIELHAYMQQRPLVEFCHENGITVTAYSPLGSRGTEKLLSAVGMERTLPDQMSNPVVVEIAGRLNRTPAQVLLRFIIQRGITAIPKSTNQDRITQNIQVFDFDLRAEDVEKLEALDQGESGRVIDLKFLKGIEHHPEYPF
ncbi:hypothetical protein ONE63_003365 [Megalurothrips usitatus]|uniref:NADP-dependent oxidoreductase domain-containing protein n=1 Tax=Megalurothrips usitatus TaxID=439358 RepID=A0AAV7X725_9NEOP|nr:hypothetical protein ONE63_003365 [Megalurothrips usitatus]